MIVGISTVIIDNSHVSGARGRRFESSRSDQYLAKKFRHMIGRAFRLSFLPCAAAMAIAAPQARAEPACAYRIDDGDTITVAATAEVIRLMGFDTPEIGSHAWCEAELRLGERARERLTALLCGPGAVVEIVRDAAKPQDRYHRTLARVTLGGVDVAEIMISEGWARAYAGGRRKGWCSRDSRDDLGQEAGR